MGPMRGKYKAVHAVLIAAAVWLTTLAANAHELRPTVADFVSGEDGAFTLTVTTNLEQLIAGIDPGHSDTDDSANSPEYDRLRLLTPAALRLHLHEFLPDLIEGMELRFDGEPAPLTLHRAQIGDVGDVTLARDSKLTFVGTVPPGVETMTWSWAQAFGDSVLRKDMPPDGGEPTEKSYAAYLRAGQVSEPISVDAPQPRSPFAVFAEYVVVGFDHIIPKGLDHILFVIGLFLLSTRLVPLLWQVTSFTLAHSVTLALGMLGIVNLPAHIVEPLIAASIVYVAVENVVTSELSRWRPYVVFGFGLLHGLGFASVLGDFGLTTSDFVAGLIGFNVGVELGQLAVIAMCVAVAGYWFGAKPWYRARITTPASLVIASIGAWWCYERVFL